MIIDGYNLPITLCEKNGYVQRSLPYLPLLKSMASSGAPAGGASLIIWKLVQEAILMDHQQSMENIYSFIDRYHTHYGAEDRLNFFASSFTNLMIIKSMINLCVLSNEKKSNRLMFMFFGKIDEFSQYIIKKNIKLPVWDQMANFWNLSKSLTYVDRPIKEKVIKCML